MTVSIREFAKLANTSVATVSRALNGKPGVSEVRRRSIIALAEKLGYQPNQFARNLQARCSMTLGFVSANLDNRVHRALLRPLEGAARDRGYQMLIADSRQDPDRERENIEALLRYRVDGFVLFPVCDVERGAGLGFVRELGLRRAPFVVAGRTPGVPVDSVANDEEDAARQLVQHLVELGHRRFGIIAGAKDNRICSARLAGATEALEQAGVDTRGGDAASPALRTLRVETRPGDGLGESVVGWFRDGSPPTALICLANHMAARLPRPLKRAGLVIPADVSLATFDDSDWCWFAEPSITATTPRQRRMASLLLDTLLARIAAPDAAPVAHALRQRLIVRESTAPVRAGPGCS